MKNVIFIFVFLSFCYVSKSQDFKSAAGLRLGVPTSISYKMFLNETNAIEGYLGYRNYFGLGWLSVNAAYQIHKDLDVGDLDGLQWYYGFGGGINRWSSSYSSGAATFISLSGYIGLSYTFEELPINLSVDWVPSVFVGGGIGTLGGFGGGYGALSARYVLGN